MKKISTLPITLAFALACSLLPVNAVIFLAGAIILLHLYALSLEVAVVAGILFLMIALLYFRFAPKDGLYMLLTPLCLHLHLGSVMPMAAGLMGKAYSVISIICGTVSWFFLSGVKQNESALGSRSDDAAITAKFTAVLNQIMGNKEMFLVIAVFLLTALAVYLIRNLSMDYAWMAAIVVGALMNFILLFAGYVLLGISGRILGLVAGSFFSLAVALVLEFFFFNLDYSRIERVQFEDDEYYYYVKAVPKNYVAKQDKRVKTFHAGNGRKPSEKQLSE